MNLHLKMRFATTVVYGLLFAMTAQVRAAERMEAVHIDGFTPIESYRLDNGLSLILWPDPSARQLAVKVWYKVGALQEKPGTTGIAHLFEHMMLRPSKYSPPEGGLGFERILGAQIGATTRFKTTDFYASMGPENLETIIRYYADIMKNLPLDATMLANEKEAVRSEYLIWDNTPFMKILPELTKAIYPGHIAENFVTGARKDLDRITAQDCLDFYQKYYSPINAVVVLAGKFEPKRALSLAEQYFGVHPAGQKALVPPDLSERQSGKILRFSTPGDAYPVVVGYPLPFRALPPEDEAALRMAMEIVFGGANSLVGEELMNRKHLASSVEFHNSDLGLKFASLDLIGDHGDEAVEALDRAVHSLQSMDEERYQHFAFARQSDLLRSLQSPTQRAHTLGFYLTHNGGAQALGSDLRAVRSISLDRVKAIAKKYLDHQFRVAILGQPVRGVK